MKAIKNKIITFFNEKLEYFMKPNPNKNENDLEFMFEKVFHIFGKLLVVTGPILCFFLLTFMFMVTYSFYQIIIPYWTNYYPGFISRCLLNFISIYTLTHLHLYYLLAITIKPGCVDDIINSKYYKKHNPYVVDSNIEVNFTNVFNNKKNKYVSSNLNQFVDKQNDDNKLLLVNNMNESGIITSSSNSTSNSVNNTSYPDNDFKINNCHFCSKPKVVRSHHCSACGFCVLKLDHHCPWMMNCIGQNNQRYFMLFVTFAFLTAVLTSVLSVPILYYTQTDIKVFKISTLIGVLGVFIFGVFLSWNWFVLLQGRTTIETFSKDSHKKSNCPIQDFDLLNWRDNLYMTFGTRSLFKALFCFSYKKLPYSGLEWTRLVISSYKHNEVSYGRHIEDLKEENNINSLNNENNELDSLNIPDLVVDLNI